MRAVSALACASAVVAETASPAYGATGSSARAVGVNAAINTRAKAPAAMRFVWFWTFWHWSKEAHRSGAVLRGPLLGLAGHWDEWYRHEASADDRAGIEDLGRTRRGQSEFLSWLRHHWAPEAIPSDNPFVVTFVLRQLSQVPPFIDWPSLDRYRAGYGAHGIHAIVLAEESSGEAGR